MTSDEVLDLDHVPARMVVIGGGAIGCEFASTFADLGAKVTILEGLPKILPGLDDDLANVVVKQLQEEEDRHPHRRDGQGPHAERPRRHDRPLRRASEDLEVDAVVVSVGRRPFADELGLDGTGVKVDERGFVVVDEFCRTGEDGVYAIGDLINTPQLAHVGYAEAILVVKQTPRRGRRCRCSTTGCRGRSTATPRWRGPDPARTRPRTPATTSSWPSTRSSSTPGPRSSARPTACARSSPRRAPTAAPGEILGVHMVGPWVTEQLSGGYLAVNWEATVDEVAEFIQPHPSLTELFGETVMSPHRPQLQRLRSKRGSQWPK